MYEHSVLLHRGPITEDLQAMLAAMGSDGWAIVAAYAVESGTTSVHHYVMTRATIVEDKAPAEIKAPEKSVKPGKGK
jgi:hypothetical protein